jgi:chromosome segregation protein
LRFERLRLNGFKSFVDPTELPIADGLTGVVGPNGCGKSNLLEALRWVMGENRPTAMRGEGMEDVIFAGAARRPARHFAEVALVLDNADRTAPVGFNDDDTLEVVRRITREAGSAYRLNGRDLRARDVQILFADASTGAHSPALVRQGQIAELINARPKARRRVLEEAAGIAGLYQRRHEAELKLQATEANLSRLDEVIAQLAQQIAALGRQVRQAERYREIARALRRAEGMLDFRRWSDADAQRAAAEAALTEATRALGAAVGAATAATRTREGAEAALPALREEVAVAGAILQRIMLEQAALESQAASVASSIATLEGRIAQTAREGTREADLMRDAEASLGQLAAEAAAIGAAGSDAEARIATLAAEAQASTQALAREEDALGEASETLARLSARHQSAERLLSDSRATLARAQAEADRATTSAQDAQAAEAAADARHARTTAEAETARVRAQEAETALAAAEAARAEAAAREAEARAVRAATEAEATALAGEATALSRLAERETGAGGAIIDSVGVTPGFEDALGAALGDDLRMRAVEGEAATGWATLPDGAALAPLPPGAQPLAEVVDAPAALARRLAMSGIIGRERGASLQPALLPGQRLVSREGDLWRWDGLRLAAGDAPSAAANRLRQINRLAALRRDVDEATARAQGARQAHVVLQAELAAATRAEQSARDARRAADLALAAAGRSRAEAEAERAIANGRRAAAGLAITRFAAEVSTASERLAAAQAEAEGLPDLGAARAALASLREGIEAARATARTRQSALDTARRDAEARSRRMAEIGRETAAWQGRLAAARQRGSERAAESASAAAELARVRDEPARIETRRAALAEGRAAAERRSATAADDLSAAEAAAQRAQAAERAAEAAAAEARAAQAAASVRSEAAREAVADALHRIEDGEGRTPAGLLGLIGMDADDIPAPEGLEAEIARLRSAREALGAVNLRAEEDMRAVREEHDTLAGERADLAEAVRSLRAGIGSLNREGRERLLTAFEQVNTNFATLFTGLFGGGSARLVMVESDDPLEAGLEIMCQPPGKKLATLSLLSGGEQTLTALALIFGVFLANPAPICVLDEVDAPLDDANVARFCDLLDDMTRRTATRFLVITHHGVTMSRMDRLFGVTMSEPGVSQLVSVDLRRAAQLVA